MSLLPQYQRLPTDDLATSTHESKRQADDEHNNDYEPQLQTGPPSYPPRQYPAVGSDLAGTTTLIFVPRYPMKGSMESVLGVLGHDREVGACSGLICLYRLDERDYGSVGTDIIQETVSIVRRAFPTLSKYPSDRIEFLAPLHDKASL